MKTHAADEVAAMQDDKPAEDPRRAELRAKLASTCPCHYCREDRAWALRTILAPYGDTTAILLRLADLLEFGSEAQKTQLKQWLALSEQKGN